MGFFGGYKWETNPGLDPAREAITGAQDRVQHTKSAGNRYWRSILQGLAKGDTSAIGNPFLANQAAEDREADANMDPFLPPELAQSQARLQKNRNAERSGINFENYVRGQAQGAAQGNANFNLSKAQMDAQLAQALAEAEIDGREGHQTQGWGGMLMQGLIGGASAAGGLGWKPFGP